MLENEFIGLNKIKDFSCFNSEFSFFFQIFSKGALSREFQIKYQNFTNWV